MNNTLLDEAIKWKTSEKNPTTQKMKFSFKDPFSKFNQIPRKMLILSHLLKKSLIETSFLCKVT